MVTHIPETLVDDYDVYGPDTVDTRIAQLAARRAAHPMSYSRLHGGFWVATTYDDIAEVVRDRETFSSFPSAIDGAGAVGQAERLIPIELDGEAHAARRRFLNPAFSPGMARRLEPRMRELANSLIDAFLERGECEFVAEFARPFPGTIFLEMMGWPQEDAPTFYDWVSVLLTGLPGADAEENRAAREKAGKELRSYIVSFFARRRRDPRDDLTTVLLQAEVDGAPLGDDALYDLSMLMMMAGLDTVQSVLTQSFAHLAVDPAFRSQALVPENLSATVEELLRWASPALPTRTVTRPVTVGGIALEPGDRVHCPLAAANRDPQYFEDPDRPRIDREKKKSHLTFGVGAHRCLGSHIARLEMGVALQEWHRRIPEYALGPGGVGPSHLGGVWGIESLSLQFAR